MIPLATKHLAIPLIVALSLSGIVGCSRDGQKLSERDKSESYESPSSPSVDNSRLSQPFPKILINGLDGNIVPTDQIFSDRNTVVILISTTCEPCSKEVARWKSYAADLSYQYQIIGICFEPVEEVAAYVRENGINFPVYSEPGGQLVEYFTVSTYPTIVGVTAQGVVKYITPGYREGISPQRYLDLF
ncbi:MAG: TlpA family protein disulfide reductase [candidate division Zixibacteria bacterium]|nr:TlpA family protein disulfide reductase [candidate division Zixibacteria bacterium]